MIATLIGYARCSTDEQDLTAQRGILAAAKFLDYYFNNMDAGKVMLAERGLPPNTDVLAGIKSTLGNADQKAATYMSDLPSHLGSTVIAWRSGTRAAPASMASRKRTR